MAELIPYLVASAGLIGLVIGSYLNVVIYRIPAGESTAHPPSKCPKCGNGIRARHNVPVLGWLILRGKCYDCSEPISARYPIVEAFTGVAFAAATWWALTWGPGVWFLPALAYMVALSIALSVIDVETHRLPDRIVLPALIAMPVLLAVASAGTGDWSALVRALIGGLSLGVAYFVMAFAYPAGMGLGDVKLAPVVGAFMAWLGWGVFAVGAFGAFLIGAVLAVVLKLASKSHTDGGKTGIPFGPSMLVGALTGAVVGQSIWDAYLSTFTG